VWKIFLTVLGFELRALLSRVLGEALSSNPSTVKNIPTKLNVRNNNNGNWWSDEVGNFTCLPSVRLTTAQKTPQTNQGPPNSRFCWRTPQMLQEPQCSSGYKKVAETSTELPIGLPCFNSSSSRCPAITSLVVCHHSSRSQSEVTLPLRTFGRVWRQFWLSGLGKGCSWQLVGRGQGCCYSIFWVTGQLPTTEASLDLKC
jgi:hypothetical protein